MMCMTELYHRTSTPHKIGNKMKEKKKRSLIPVPPGPNTPSTQYINCSCNDVFHLEEQTLGGPGFIGKSYITASFCIKSSHSV